MECLIGMFDFCFCRPDLEIHFHIDSSIVDKRVETQQIPKVYSIADKSVETQLIPNVHQQSDAMSRETSCPYTMSEEEIDKRVDEYLRDIYFKGGKRESAWEDNVSTMSELPGLRAIESDSEETTSSNSDASKVESSPCRVPGVKQWDSSNHPLLLKQRTAKSLREDEPDRSLRHALFAEDHVCQVGSAAQNRSATTQATAQHIIRSVLAGVLHKKAAVVKCDMLAPRTAQMLLGKAKRTLLSHLHNLSMRDTVLRRAAVKSEAFRVVRAAYAGCAATQTKMIQTAAIRQLDDEIG